MIILTGAAGFIGTHLAERFAPMQRLLLVDKPEHFRTRNVFKPEPPQPMDFATGKEPEERHKILDREYFPKILLKLPPSLQANAANDDPIRAILPAGEKIDWVLHIGACTDTGETDIDYLNEWNVEYSKKIWNWCAEHKVPLIYASSGATYGNGSEGFSDDHQKIPSLRPLNPYGQSKQDFDLWVLEEIKKGHTPPHWYGLKFFNVYGPKESHKGPMASAVLHSYRAIKEKGRCSLFRSHHPEVKDGEQSRDFIHVSDIVNIIAFLMDKKPSSGIYNCGTGKARTFLDLIRRIFSALPAKEQIDWMDTPERYRKAYQYFTQAEMNKLHSVGYKQSYLSLEDGVGSYVAWLKEHEKPLDKKYN